jgi:hypothetical protein
VCLPVWCGVALVWLDLLFLLLASNYIIAATLPLLIASVYMCLCVSTYPNNNNGSSASGNMVSESASLTDIPSLIMAITLIILHDHINQCNQRSLFFRMPRTHTTATAPTSGTAATTATTTQEIIKFLVNCR